VSVRFGHRTPTVASKSALCRAATSSSSLEGSERRSLATWVGAILDLKDGETRELECLGAEPPVRFRELVPLKRDANEGRAASCSNALNCDA